MEGSSLDALIEVYDKQVAEADENGFADKFKICTEFFFKDINDSYPLEDSPVHFEDIEYLDGYFIFGMGTNSVVHFHIKECPGWKFAIWWSPPEGEKITGEFFTQYEETLDKFKPSRSICRDITMQYSAENITCSCYEVARLINYIHQEPYLAFCMDYYGWNYNEEYHTREEAKQKYDEYRIWQDNKNKFTKINNDNILLFVSQKNYSIIS